MLQTSTTKALASHVLALMMVGINNDVKECIAYFATTSAKTGFLYQCMWKAVAYLEICGMKVSRSQRMN